MSKNLNGNFGSMEYDGLINSGHPAAETFAVTILKGQTALTRGTLLGRNTAGKAIIYNGSTTSTAFAILAEGTDAATDADLVAVAYRTGHFNGNKLTVASGYTLTDDDKETLRGKGILLSDAE